MTSCYSLGRIIVGVLGWSGQCVRAPSAPLICQTRNIIILKRRWPPRLSKSYRRPKLKSRNYVYDLVEDTRCRKQPNLDVILTSYVQGLGERGDTVSIKQNYAYNKLLLPGLAVYASPQNVEKFKEECLLETRTQRFSSPTAERAVEILSRRVLSVVLNKETEWTLQPWHIRMSFRKAGFIVPEYAIEIPKKPIQGPNLNIEGKEFTVTVTINKTERVPVRCRIHHWSTQPSNRLPYEVDPWLQPAEEVFPDE